MTEREVDVTSMSTTTMGTGADWYSNTTTYVYLVPEVVNEDEMKWR